MNELIIYSSSDGVQVEVTFEKETFWLSLNQISALFDRDKSVISRHLRNIFKEGELDEKATVAKNATVQKEGTRTIERTIEYYNLDAILSVGYRVNSQQGTQFRIWATQRLKDYLVQGYAINQKRLNELQQTVQLITQKAEKNELNLPEAKGLLEIINNNIVTFLKPMRYNSLLTKKLLSYDKTNTTL